MRMRKKKNGAKRLALCEQMLYKHEGEPMGEPYKVFSESPAPVLLEIGAGKGGFARQMARRYPETCYFAMERVSDCVVLAAEAVASEGGIENLRFIIDNADNLPNIFAKETIDGVFLNFSDPWPKKGYAKRRLTHRRYLSLYLSLMKEGARLTFKTDNEGLFNFTLEEIEAMGLTPVKLTRDLHSSEFLSDNVMTEYERNFVLQGMKINMVQIEKPTGFSVPEVPASVIDTNENN